MPFSDPTTVLRGRAPLSLAMRGVILTGTRRVNAQAAFSARTSTSWGRSSLDPWRTTMPFTNATTRKQQLGVRSSAVRTRGPAAYTTPIIITVSPTRRLFLTAHLCILCRRKSNSLRCAPIIAGKTLSILGKGTFIYVRRTLSLPEQVQLPLIGFITAATHPALTTFPGGGTAMTKASRSYTRVQASFTRRRISSFHPNTQLNRPPASKDLLP